MSHDKICVLVAHPDDEVIFFFPWLFQNSRNALLTELGLQQFVDCSVDVICMTCADNVVRCAEFQQITGELKVGSRIFDHSIERQILSSNYKTYVAFLNDLYAKYPLIVTHSIYGDDHFHPQHSKLSLAALLKAFSRKKFLVCADERLTAIKHLRRIITQTDPGSLRSWAIFLPKLLLIVCHRILMRRRAQASVPSTWILRAVEIYESQDLDYSRFTAGEFHFGKML